MEKAPGSSGSKPTKKLGKGYGDIFKKKNEGPFDPIEVKDQPKWAGEEKKKTPDTKAASAAEVAKVVGPKHQEMLGEAEQEANERREHERLTNIRETVELLDSEAQEAAQKGDTVLSKQLRDASRELVTRLERERSVRTTREFVKNYSDTGLNEVVDVLVKESRRRNTERNGEPHPTGGEITKLDETMSGIDDETLENIVRGLREEVRERAEKRGSAQQELTTQVDADLKTAGEALGGTEDLQSLLKELAARGNAKAAAQFEQMATRMEGDIKDAGMENTKFARPASWQTPASKRLGSEKKREAAGKAGEEKLPTVLQEIKDKNAARMKTGKAATPLTSSAAAPEAKPGPEAPPVDDKAQWREYFGPLAEAQEAAEKKSNEDIEEWKKHYGPLAEIQEAQEAAGKGAETAVQPPEETTPEQWEAHYKEAAEAKAKAESFGYTVSPEKFTQAVKEARGERDRVLDQKTPEQHKNFMRRMMEGYRAMPTRYKLIISGALLGAAVGSSIFMGPASTLAWTAWIAQRGASAFGVAAAADLATERWKNRYLAGIISGGAGVAAAFVLPGFVKYLDNNFLHIGDYVRNWLGFHKAGVPLPQERPAGAPGPIIGGATSPFDPNLTPGAPGWIEHAAAAGAGIEHLFNNSVMVTDQDRLHGLWGILERKLTDANVINPSTSTETKYKMLSFLENRIRSLGFEGIKQLGFASGDINKIYPGNMLDLSILDKEGLIKQVGLFR